MAEEKKTIGDPSGPTGFKSGLTATGGGVISYQAAVEKVKKMNEYTTLRGVVEDPYLMGDSYNWLVDFLESRATRFWRYLKIRENGSVDQDKFRAASILEYSRLIARLVENFPEFNLKLTPQVLKQFPQDFPDGRAPSPAELAARLEELNRRDYLGGGPEPPRTPPAGPTAPAPAPPRAFPGERAGEILQEIVAGIEEQIGRESPQFAGFSFESKCGLLGSPDWRRIIGGVAKKYPELGGFSIPEVVENLLSHTDDPRGRKIFEFVRQFGS